MRRPNLRHIINVAGLIALFWAAIWATPAVGQAALPAVVTATTADPAVQLMIEQVQTADLIARLNGLTGEQPVVIGGAPYTILTRHTTSGEPIEKATQYAAEQFAAAGLSVVYHPWTFQVGAILYSGRNVIGEIVGLQEPERIVLLSAHLDNRPSGPRAPGADDNGSGSVALLAIADVLGRYDWNCTLRFGLWTGEEQGLLGSQVYAGQVAAAGQNIVGVINLDMIAYDTDAFPIIDLHARSAIPNSVALAQLFASMPATYQLPLTPEVLIDVPLGNQSDNRAFWDRGYSAILAIEDRDDFNAFYHTVNDTVANINPAYYTAFTRAALATFVHLANCLATPFGTLSGDVRNLANGAPIPYAELTIATAGNSATAPAPLLQVTADATGRYAQRLPAGIYDVTAAALGFNPSTSGVSVTGDGTTTLDFNLQPSTATAVGLRQIDATPPALWPVLILATALLGVTLWHGRQRSTQRPNRP